MGLGHGISLDNEVDRQANAVLVNTAYNCWLFLEGKPKLGENLFYVKLEFKYAMSVQSVCSEGSPAVDNTYAVNELTDTDWNLEFHKAYDYAGTPLPLNRRHFVINVHDIFHEILAESFHETKVVEGTIEFEAIKLYF